MMWQQHQLIRQHALGNFRALLQSITIDPAMLLYLDGGSSVATAPNENYGREVMELFALGRNQYTQSDVHSAALSLAGWTVDYEQATSAFDAARGYPRPVEFLGKHGRLTAKDVIDIICDHPHCAMHVAGRIYYHLVGAEPTPEIATRLGQVMRSHNLAIAPVVAEILKDPTFMGSAMQRPRSPVEWVTAAVRAMELPDDGDPNQGADPTRRFQWSQLLGQTPFAPPNVAGWPDGSQWLNAGYALERERLALNAKPLDTIIQAEDPVTAALEQCALFTVSPSTRSALQSIVANVRDFTVQSRLLLAATIASPEFALS